MKCMQTCKRTFCISFCSTTICFVYSDMHKDLCRGVSGLCDAMRPTKGADLLKYLRKVNFTGLSGDRFHFNNNGDGPARYNIIHFKQVETGKYRWIKVGEYYEGELRLNMSGKNLFPLARQLPLLWPPLVTLSPLRLLFTFPYYHHTTPFSFSLSCSHIE